MARGFLLGAVWGTVLSGVGAGTLSIMSEPPVGAAAPLVDAAMPVMQDQTGEAQTAPDQAALGGDRAPDAPRVASAAPEAASPDSADPGATGVIVAPEVGAAPGAPDAAQKANDSAGDSPVAVSSEAPVGAAAPGGSLRAPSPDAAPAQVADPGVIVLDVEGAEEPEFLPEPAPLEEDGGATVQEAQEGQADGAQDGPAIGTRAGSLVDRTPAVAQNRLVSIQSPGASAEAAEESGAEAGDTTAVTLPDDAPLMKNASRFAPEADVPRMAIVLIDDGSGPMGPAELETFPFPVSFAIPPNHPDPAGAAQGYRDRGFEVLALGDLPDGAQPSDVEVTLTALTDMLPQAVGVLEDPAGGLQDTSETAAQTAAFLKASGHGLVMLPKGLNTAQKLAAKEGVPSVSLFRDLDSEGQDQGMIRRALDQAAFRARQEGQVVMLGRIRADTVSALLLWGLQDRDNTMTLVPISTVLKESLAGE